VITPTSHNLRKELSNYIWNDKKAGIPVDAFNHCFVGETMISTINGLVRIDEIKVGDLVLTSKGYKPVLKVFNNGLKQVEKYSMQLDTILLSLTSTKSHLIKTDTEWTQISKLKSGQKVYLHNHLTTKSTHCIQKKNTFQEALKECTLLFMSLGLVKYLKDFMFTTLTAIHGIIGLKTWNLLKPVNICKLTGKKGLSKIKNGLKSFIQKVLRKRSNGTNQKRVASGIQSNKKRIGLLKNGIQKIVKCVIRNTKHHSQQQASIVIRTANLKHLEKGESSMKNVYDLMVADEHEYFANGLLVHNCIDPLRYSTMYLTKHKTSTGIRKNSLI
jgi:hypothetical protein